MNGRGQFDTGEDAGIRREEADGEHTGMGPEGDTGRDADIHREEKAEENARVSPGEDTEGGPGTRPEKDAGRSRAIAAEAQAARNAVRIRGMAASDLEAVWKLEQECFSDAWSMKLLAEAASGEYDYFFLAEYEGQVCGYADLRILAGEGEIERIAVTEKRRRLGIGKKLMEEMVRFASGQGAEDLTLEVRLSNTAARKLYESCGFAEEGRRKGYYRNPPDDALILWRRGSRGGI